MNNFQVAIDATATAMDSAGSAMKENTSYMESLEAQTTQLKATFQDFANNVIDKELVSSILTLANDALGLLNTETGKTITQWALLTGVFTGGLTIYGQIASKLIGAAKSGLTFASAIAGAGTAASGAAVGFGTLATTALPIAAILAGVAIAGWEVYKWIKETHKPFQEYTDEIQANTQQLEQNRDRLAEIEQMSWTDKTPEILDEYDALVQQNEELQRNIELLEKRRSNRAKDQARKGGEVETGGTYYTAVGFDDATQYKTAEDAYLSLASANYLVVESAEDAKKQLEAMGITLQENAEMVKVDADAYNEDLTASMQNYADQLNSTHSLNQDQLRDFESLKTEVGERVAGLQQLQAEGETLTDSEQALIAVYEQLIQAESDATDFTEKYGEASTESSRKVTDLVNSLAIAASQSGKTEAAFYQLVAAEKVFNNTSLNVSEKIAALQQLAAQAGITATLLTASSTATHDQMSGYIRTQRMKGMSESQAIQSYLQSIYKEFMSFTPTVPTSVGGGGGSGGSKGKSSKSSATKQYTDKALEQFKSLQKDIEHQLNLGEITEKEYYDKLEGLVKQYKTNATAHMKEYGLNVNQINQNMYQYEEEIYKGRAKLAENLKDQQKQAAEEAAQAEKEALEQQRSNYEKAVNYIVDKIDEQISKLEQQKSDIEKFYDDQIQALQDTNDELERQIQYEQLLNNLAQAKDKGLYVFSNGQFQYMQDVEAISAAQAELDAYDRDEALRKEVERLNKLKDRAVESIDKQIEKWQEYRDEWSDVVNQYSNEQDKLLAEQLFGIDTEQKNWETRLANAQEFADKYNAIMASLDAASGATTSGDGYSFNGTGTGGWSEAEMNEGFVSSGSSSKSSKKSISQMRNEANAALEKSKSTGKKVSLGGGVSIDYSRVNKHAEGTLGTPGGLSLVGEQGPELRVLGQGDGVIPADITRNLWDWGKINPSNIGGNTTHIFNIDNLTLPNVNDAKSLVAGLKNLAYQRAYKRA